MTVTTFQLAKSSIWTGMTRLEKRVGGGHVRLYRLTVLCTVAFISWPQFVIFIFPDEEILGHIVTKTTD